LPTAEPTDLAEHAATAVNKLNHATLPGARPGLTHPSDAYTVTSSLKELAGHLPQTFEQINAFLTGLHEDGLLRLDNGRDPAAALAQLDDALQQAATAAEHLRAALDHAHTALGPIGYQPRATAARQHTAHTATAASGGPATAPSTGRHPLPGTAGRTR
jgi:hypothetical protein